MVGLCEGGSPEPPTRSLAKPDVGESEPLAVAGGLEAGPRVGLAGDGGTGGGGRGLLAAGLVDGAPSAGWYCSLSSDTIGFHEVRSAAEGDGGVVGEETASWDCGGEQERRFVSICILVGLRSPMPTACTLVASCTTLSIVSRTPRCPLGHTK